MQSINIETNARSEYGKGAVRRLRRTGFTPAVIYRAGNVPISIAVDPTVLQLGFTRTGDRNTLVKLDVDGNEHVCLVKEVQRHPVQRTILHVDFYELRMDEELEVKVKVVPEGRAIGEELGGRISLLARSVDVRCLPENIPGELLVDVTKLDVGDVVTVAQLTSPDGATLLFEEDYNVLVCLGRPLEEELEEEIEDEEGDEEGDSEEESDE